MRFIVIMQCRIQLVYREPPAFIAEEFGQIQHME